MCLYFTFRQMKKKTQISGNERKFKKQLLNKTRLLSNLLYKQKKLYFTTTLQKEITRTHKPQKLDCSLTAKQTFWNETTTHARESDSTSRPSCARKFDFFSSHCSIPYPNKQQHHQRERESKLLLSRKRKQLRSDVLWGCESEQFQCVPRLFSRAV